MAELPIESILPEIRNVLGNGCNATLVAPPGSGKTTRIPLALLQEPWLEGRRMILLEPRRLAVRSVAEYMAAVLGERPGQTVGYRMKLDTCIGPQTRIEVVTEGVLTRLIQADAALEDVGIIIFDEFHERSLQSDLGLALSIQIQSILRPDLRLLVMSATMEAEKVSGLLGGAPVLRAEGNVFPVKTVYAKQPCDGKVEEAIVATIGRAIIETAGDMLVFLPGAAEIWRVQRKLQELLPDEIGIAPLHGSLPLAAQQLALQPNSDGRRKVVLATSIAETSLTVPGIEVVVDSGLMRVPRFSAQTGMSRLETIRVSAASASQRRGRAGRLKPGVCYRLWTEEENKRLCPYSIPEILATDLTSMVLELAMWGTADPLELEWLDLPPEQSLEQARKLLRELGAINRTGAVTEYGRKLVQTGVHPRLAHMILQADLHGLASEACDLAVLLSGRDIFKNGMRDVDIRLRVEALRCEGQFSEHASLANRRQLSLESRRLKTLLHIRETKRVPQTDFTGVLLAWAYPDRIAQRRDTGKYLLQNGRGAFLPGEQLLAQEAYVVAPYVDDAGGECRILLAAPLTVEQIREFLSNQIEKAPRIAWDAETQAVRARQIEQLGAITLKEMPLPNPDAETVAAVLLQAVAEQGLAMLPWTKAALQFRQRVLFVAQREPGWPDMSDNGLLTSLEHWLLPYIYGMSSREMLQRLPLLTVLESMVSWEQRQMLDEYAPTHISVPSGRKLPVDYSNLAEPVLAVRLQELFGLCESPRIAQGTIALTLHLLSPAGRPVQVTKDLSSFWQSAYFEVKKDLLGRYPKHYWPDNPLVATPTHRAKPR